MVRLLDEAVDGEHAFDALDRLAALDVAVAGIGVARLDAEGDQSAGLRRGEPAHDGTVEVDQRGDDVVGRLHEHQGIGVACQKPQGGRSDRRPGVAGERLEQDGLGLDADLLQLVVNQKPVILVADQDRCGKAYVAQSACRSVLQHRPFGRELEELLGIRRARQRPQACPCATGQDDRMDLRRSLFLEFREGADCIHELRALRTWSSLRSKLGDCRQANQ